MDNPFFSLLVLALASYRVAEMLVYDEGPFDAIEKVRIKAGVYDMNEDGRSKTNLGRFLSCTQCTGLWASVLLTLLFFLFDSDLYNSFIFILAVTGFQSYMSRR